MRANANTHKHTYIHAIAVVFSNIHKHTCINIVPYSRERCLSRNNTTNSNASIGFLCLVWRHMRPHSFTHVSVCMYLCPHSTRFSRVENNRVTRMSVISLMHEINIWTHFFRLTWTVSHSEQDLEFKWQKTVHLRRRLPDNLLACPTW